MKQITIQRTLQALRAIGTESERLFTVDLEEGIRQKALLPIERMLAFS